MGNLRLESGATLAFGDGTNVKIENLLVERALRVLGDITIEGMARFLGDVRIGGELVVSNRQAGFAVIPQTGTSVTVRFASGFTAQPVVTASPNVPVLFAVSKATQTGFTIRIAAPAGENITFSWLALSTDVPETVEGKPSGEFIIFPLDARGVPLSSDMLWNLCMRNQTPLAPDGQPYNCSRYHEGSEWRHPDLQMFFTWNQVMDPPLLTLPDGYRAVRQETADSSASSITESSVSSEASSEASAESSISSEQSSSAESQTSSESFDSSASSESSEESSSEQASSAQEEASSDSSDPSASSDSSSASL
jgi:hypothetical protein